MSQQYLSVELAGYWRDAEARSIPEEAGIFCVYTCEHDRQDGSLSVHKLVYVGKSRNVRYRITHHADKGRWERHLGSGEELCYSTAPVSHIYRERCLAALVFAHQPPENSEYRDSFPFDTTAVSLTGKTRLLKPNFTVERTAVES